MISIITSRLNLSFIKKNTKKSHNNKKISSSYNSKYQIKLNTSFENNHDKSPLHVITFQNDNIKSRGIYTVRYLNENLQYINHIISFKNLDDAIRYKTLLEPLVHYPPQVELYTYKDIQYNCADKNTKLHIVESNILIVPPNKTAPLSDWELQSVYNNEYL